MIIIIINQALKIQPIFILLKKNQLILTKNYKVCLIFWKKKETWHDKFSCIVFGCKTVSWQDKLEGRRQDKN